MERRNASTLRRMRGSSQEEFEEEFKRKAMTRCSSGGLEGRFGLVDGRVEKESVGGRPSIASQGASEDGRRRLQVLESHGVGEFFSLSPFLVGRDSSVETTLSNFLLNDLQSGHVFSFVWMVERAHRQSIDVGADNIGRVVSHCHLPVQKAHALPM